MSYESARAAAITRVHTRHLARLVAEYRPGRPTVVLLPGAMGSALERSRRPYVDDGAPLGGYDTVWMDSGIVFDHEFLDLAILPGGHDVGEHVIVPDGPLQFVVWPYWGTEAYLRGQGFNFLVFGFDWRRALDESAAYLERFLAALRDAVRAAHGEDPLPSTTLVGHSMGGLLPKVLLDRLHRRGEDAGRWMARFVTVGTPFYGSDNHMSRYYKGVPPLNLLYGARALAPLVGTMPGPYVFLCLDRATYRRDGAALGLQRYPVRDAADDRREADPSDPALADRYPDWVDRGSIDAALRDRDVLTRPLPAPDLARMFHLRSVADPTTLVELCWAPVRGRQFDPEGDPDPITGQPGPGDGTVPAWSGRLAQTPRTQVYDLQVARDHPRLCEHVETLEVLRVLIETGHLPARVEVADITFGSPRASRPELEQFLAEAAAGRLRAAEPRALDPAVWGALADAITGG